MTGRSANLTGKWLLHVANKPHHKKKQVKISKTARWFDVTWKPRIVLSNARSTTIYFSLIFGVSQMFVIPYVFGPQLYNLAVSLILTCSFTWLDLFIWSTKFNDANLETPLFNVVVKILNSGDDLIADLSKTIQCHCETGMLVAPTKCLGECTSDFISE